MTTSIILADDHAIFRQCLIPLLNAERELELLAQAGNGHEAWELIESLEPDVAILDISMPKMSGIEIARKMIDAGLSTYIVLLTMHPNGSVKSTS